MHHELTETGRSSDGREQTDKRSWKPARYLLQAAVCYSGAREYQCVFPLPAAQVCEPRAYQLFATQGGRSRRVCMGADQPLRHRRLSQPRLA